MRSCIVGMVLAALALVGPSARAVDADLILHNGRIVTVDSAFSIAQAVAIQGGVILRVGTNEDVLKTRGLRTTIVDLDGKTALPGLIDSHVHASDAAMTEFDHPIPDMESVADVLEYVRGRAQALPEGTWIEVRQVFITRLREPRYPTRAELDAVAPKHPVVFSTGPDASLNSLALTLSGIDKGFRVTDGGTGFAEKDLTTGELTGILRSCTRYVKSRPTGREATDLDRADRLRQLFHDYNSVGLTGVIDRNASAGALNQYRRLLDNDALTVRIAASHQVGTSGAIEAIEQNVRKVADHPLCRGGPMLRVIGIKTFLDGGMLTGSAAMREPWGTSKIYSITDPQYRGLLFISKDRLTRLVRTAAEVGLQFTAHSVGDDAVHTLLDVYADLDMTTGIRKTRPCLTHSNFMSQEAIAKCATLGVVIDVQPAWLYLDTRTLVRQFGIDRLRWFQPLKSLFAAGVTVGGGSDHMQKIGSLRSINPYNPFLGMQTAVTRRARWYDGQLHPEEALTREQAVRLYTINNARLMFLEDRTGSLEVGKAADMVVLDRDVLTCPEDAIKDTQCLRTYLNGKLVYERK
ncbi:MAG: amidohydrolase [Gemmataceae bacterium]